jgi:pyruvate dehydrogenase E1 component alpha subunit
MPVKKKAQPVVVEAAKTHTKPTLSRETLVEFLRQMLRIRRLEERAAQAYGQGSIGGFCHLYIGQEAVAVGALATLRPDDRVLTTYRDHGMALVRGMSPLEIFGELFGRECGCSKGRGGSMHMFSKELNFLGGHGIVGAHLALGTGAAFASKYWGKDSVTLCFFGEGAVQNGAFHEALNLAGLWGLPIVYLCENNRYGMGTAVERVSPLTELHKKAEAYAMAHRKLDGMDVLAVHEGLLEAVAEARKYRPSFVELDTYRFRGHSMSDPVHSVYRSKEEVERQKEKDPITILAQSLEADGVFSPEEFKVLDKEVTTEIKQAMEEALQSPEPDPSTVHDHVYREDPYASTRLPGA